MDEIDRVHELGHKIANALDRGDMALAAELAREQRAIVDELVGPVEAAG